jgi:hypothetical protein
VEVAFEVVGWPGHDGAGPLGALSRTPAARVVCSLEIRPRSARSPASAERAGAAGAAMVSIRAVVRVAAVPTQVQESVEALTARATELGVRLRRLDGWHAPAAYASAPTGGGPR